MRIGTALAVIGFGLIGYLGLPATAAAAMDEAASKVCLKCHEEDLEKYNKTAHAVTADPRSPTCVSCHGASEEHASKKGRRPVDRSFKGENAVSTAEASQVCLSCHQKGIKQVLWAGSRHPEADVSCSGCHKVHVNHDKTLAKATQADVCFACHKEQRNKVNLPSRHPIAEGKMTCSDCHNPHGSSGPKLVRRDSVNDTCYTCHAEKRGPFVHQHQPATEDCGICHNPHGSAIPGMLTARAPILCNQCHTPHTAGGVGAVGGQPGVFPPPAPGQSSSAVTGTSSGINTVNIWQGRSCMNCHTQVHGSNNPSVITPAPSQLFR
jgi:DmsE family decaheme c-type cytochrome